METFEFLMTHVKQQTKEVLGILLLVLRVVVLKELLKNVLSIYHLAVEWFIELELRIEVLLNVTEFGDCAFRV